MKPHLNLTDTCACGRLLQGNGMTSHRRTCERSLAENGWPLASAMQQEILDEYPEALSALVLTEVQRKFGEIYLERRRGGDKTELPWDEFWSLMWEFADATEKSMCRP